MIKNVTINLTEPLCSCGLRQYSFVLKNGKYEVLVKCPDCGNEVKGFPVIYIHLDETTKKDQPKDSIKQDLSKPTKETLNSEDPPWKK